MPTPLFDQVSQGQASVNAELWVDLGLIPNGNQFMFGFASYSPDGKTLIFELRSNNAGQSTGATGTTSIHSRTSVRDGDTKDVDYYKSAKTAIKTGVSTGVEHWWMRITSKSQAVADAYWWIYYTTI